MLGVASERALILLLEDLTDAMTDPTKKQQLQRFQENYRTKQKFDRVKQEIMVIRRKLPREISDVLETHFDGIFTLIRITRNYTGHPTAS